MGIVGLERGPQPDRRWRGVDAIEASLRCNRCGRTTPSMNNGVRAQKTERPRFSLTPTGLQPTGRWGDGSFARRVGS